MDSRGCLNDCHLIVICVDVFCLYVSIHTRSIQVGGNLFDLCCLIRCDVIWIDSIWFDLISARVRSCLTCVRETCLYI